MESGGIAKWSGGTPTGLPHPEGSRGPKEWRDEVAPHTVHPGGTLITRRGADVRWWTWAGYRTNATLGATLSTVADPLQRPTCYLRLREDLTPHTWQAARNSARSASALVLPDVEQRAVHGLKFAVALPTRLATATLAARLADFEGARETLAESVRFSSGQ